MIDLTRLRSLGTACLLLSLPSFARADPQGPDVHGPRGRPCCALAADMVIHLASTHVPVVIRGVISTRGVGRHSYLTDGELTENNGLVYTRRGGFVDTAHTRDNADTAAFLALKLRPLLACGQGRLDFGSKGGERGIRITKPVPAKDLVRTSDLLAIRITFDLSVWTELVQYYGLTKFRGAQEIYSAFTVDDLYSNLLGAQLGVAALESRVPYDRAMDIALATAFQNLGAVSQAETRRVLARLAGTWWRPDYAWPASEIAIVRQYQTGPTVSPKLASSDIIGTNGQPVVLDVPQTDDSGARLSEFFELELKPKAKDLVRFPKEEQQEPTLTEQDIPRLVDEVHRALDADAARTASDKKPTTEAAARGAVGHYLTGIRLMELSAAGGVQRARGKPTAVLGGGVQMVRGDTRSGDFGLMQLAVLHSESRGLMAGLSFFHSEALWFCHDPETASLHAPLVSLLGPCAPGEWLGLGGSLGEAAHDGGTGRTVLRPISLAAVLNPLANGQSASYDKTRLLLRAGAEVEHIWSSDRGGRTLPRVATGLSFLLRTPAQHWQLHGALAYRLDPGVPADAVFESDLSFGYNFLLGGTSNARHHGRLDPWGLASLALEGCYSYWMRPENAYSEVAAPFVATDRRQTWQLLLAGTLGFEGLSF